MNKPDNSDGSRGQLTAGRDGNGAPYPPNPWGFHPLGGTVARDIFAIPVSTVASESAFSTSGRVLSEHRSRLTPDLLEALMCLQNWQRNKAKGLYSIL
jgi:hypothetical protein